MAKLATRLGLAALLLALLLGNYAMTAREDAVGPPAEFKRRYGEWAVVVGASVGLGKATVVEAARRGLHVVALARSKDALEKLRAEVQKEFPKIKVETEVVDIADVERTGMAIRNIVADKSKTVGLLAYVAAVSSPGEFALHDPAIYDKLVDANVKSLVRTLREVVPGMKERKRGGVMVLSSMAGVLGQAMVSVYAGTKSFQRAFVEALAYELKPHNVDVICPIVGPTRTDAYMQTMSKDFRDSISFVEQDPEDVVVESFRMLGRGVPAFPTGPVGKLVGLLMRFLPYPIAMEMQNGQASKAFTGQPP